MSPRKFSYRLLAVCCGFIISCGHNRLEVDVSAVHIAPVKIGRFDQDLFALNADNIIVKLPELQKKYNGFTELFTDH